MIANPKPERIMDRVRRHIRRRDTKAAEERIMRAVRAEDRYCRFPGCGCGRLKLGLEVAHAGQAGHRKMGGNPSLSATVPENLILLCAPRHRKHRFAVDRKTLRVEPLTDAGLRGQVRWWIDASRLPDDMLAAMVTNPRFVAPGEEWLLAVETRPHTFLPFTPEQAAILKLLSGMEC